MQREKGKIGIRNNGDEHEVYETWRDRKATKICDG